MRRIACRTYIDLKVTPTTQEHELADAPFRLGDWLVEPRLNRLTRGDESIQIELKMMDVLVCLAGHAGELVTRQEIIDTVWSVEYITEKTLTRAVAELRRTLGDDAKEPTYIETIHRKGYRLIVPVEAVTKISGTVTLFPGAQTARDDRSPYPGLAAFTEADAELFFGREAEVSRLWRTITTRRLLAVIGPSGVGKTSFLRAGLIPAAPEGWGILICTPGEAPFAGLARALAPEISDDPESVSKLVDFEVNGPYLFTRWRERHERALLIVDQFEELFTQNPPEVQAGFAALIGRLARDADVHVLLSLRDDFLYRCHDHFDLLPVFTGLTPLKAPGRDNLRRALVQPAARLGYSFEDEALVDEMLDAVEGERGALPLLAFAVARLWEKRDRERKLLTRQAYADIGGVAGALAHHAEQTLERIGTDRLPVVRDLFRNLVTAEGTRAAREWNELLSVFCDSSDESQAAVLSALIDARLLTSYEVREEDREPTRRVEIIHESLLANWPRLVRWQTQDADAARLHDELRQAARIWREHGQTDDLLWTGSAYREYAVWRERYPGGLSELEEAFAVAMTSLATRRRRRRRIAVAAVIVLLVAVLGVVGTLWRRSVREARRAEAEAGRHEAAEILSLGRLRLGDHPNAALAYAIASLERADTEPARRFAVEALWQGPPALYLSDPVVPLGARWSSDGRWLAVGGTRGLAILDRETGGRRELLSGFERPLGFSTDCGLLVSEATGDGGGTVIHVWTVAEGRLQRTLELEEGVVPQLLDDSLLTFAFDADTGTPPEDQPAIVRRIPIHGTGEEVAGRWQPHGLSYLDSDPSGASVFSLQAGRIVQQSFDDLLAPPRVLGVHEGDANLWFWPGHERVVTGDSGGDIRIWDLHSARRERTLESSADARLIALDPRGQRLAVGPPGSLSSPRSLCLFDLDAPRSAEPVPLLNDEVNWLNGMTFSPDGAWLATMSNPFPLTLWNVAARHSIVIGRQIPSYVSAVFTSDGRLVSTSDEGVVRLWPLSPETGEGVRELWSRPGATIGFHLAEIASERSVVVIERFAARILVLPFDGSPASIHQLAQSAGDAAGTALLSLDPTGRYAAMSYVAKSKPAATSLRILDLSSGAERILDAHATGGDGCERVGSLLEGVVVPVWLADGRLLSDGDAGLRSWDLDAGTSIQLRPCRTMTEDLIELLAAPGSGAILRLDPASGGRSSTISAFDLTTGETHEIASHGNRVGRFSLDTSGHVLLTGSNDGVVRVGPLTGEEPHLLFGHTGPVTSVAFSPDGRWIASGSDDGTIRLWPMPDLSKPPLHTLPREELIAKLKTLTNLRAVRDDASSTGWKVEVGPFPGWETVPTW